MQSLRSQIPRLFLILALAIMGAGMSAWLFPAESNAVSQHLLGFPDSDLASHHARPWVLVGLCFVPALAGVCYSLGGTLDRYITRQFLIIFSICLSSLFMIWFLIDLSDKVSEFRNSDNAFVTIITFYATRSPAILLLLLPYSLLLSLLYSLGKLSTNREIIAIIQSGRGVLRTTFPLIVAGILCTIFCLGLNYHWAPIAEGRQDEILAEAGGELPTEATQVLYRNPESRRLWMIGAFPPNYQKGNPLLNVEITSTGQDQCLQSRLSASSASWNRETREWTFANPVIGRYSPGKPPEFMVPEHPLIIDSWNETPWQLIKPGLSAEYLGIPDLTTWILANRKNHGFADPSPYLTHWHYRWALPFTCLVTVLLATPLAIHFSRRGAGSGVFVAVVLSALMLLFNNISLAFGEAGIWPPSVAAWLPNGGFALLGLYLFRRRIIGRPIYHSLRNILPSGG